MPSSTICSGSDVELDVGRLGAGARPGRSRPPRRSSRRSGPVFDASNSSSAAGSSASQQALGSGRRPDAVGGGVVAEVLADRGLVEQHLDFAHRQVLGRADAGEHQQLRRVEGAAAEDHLALGAQLLRLAELARLDPDRAGALEEHPVDVHEGHHGQVRPLHRRVQVGDGGAGAHPVALGHLVHADPVLLGAVEVLVAGQPGFDAGLDEGGGDGACRSAGRRPAAARRPRATRRRRARCPRPSGSRGRGRPRPSPATPHSS